MQEDNIEIEQIEEIEQLFFCYFYFSIRNSTLSSEFHSMIFNFPSRLSKNIDER